VQARGWNESVASAVRDMMRSLGLAMPLHHEDEARHVLLTFPCPYETELVVQQGLMAQRISQHPTLFIEIQGVALRF